jgi:hypothetical protein
MNTPQPMNALVLLTCIGDVALFAFAMHRRRAGIQETAMLWVALLALIGFSGAGIFAFTFQASASVLALALTVTMLVAEHQWKKRQSNAEPASTVEAESAKISGPHPVEEAKVYAAYGRIDEARKILEEHLQVQPDEARTLEALRELECFKSIEGCDNEFPFGKDVGRVSRFGRRPVSPQDKHQG